MSDADAAVTGTKNLGARQRDWLRRIADQGGAWSEGSGYACSSPAKTRRMTESLEARGLLARGERPDHLMPPAGGGPRGPIPEWRVTPAGRAALDPPVPADRAALAAAAVSAAIAALAADPPRDPRRHLAAALAALAPAPEKTLTK